MIAKQDVVYSFFNRLTLLGSKLVVITVGNMMNLLGKGMTWFASSWMGMIRMTLQPRTITQSEKIVQAWPASAKAAWIGCRM